MNFIRNIKDYINNNNKVRVFAIPIYKKFFFNSNSYWEKRYKSGGNSGSGSYGRLAEFKASIINDFVNLNRVSKILEFGCGDGANLELYNFKEYIGLDVSKTIVNANKEKFKDKKEYKFLLMSELDTNLKSDLTLSLDVIYHLTNDKIFNDYFNKLFNNSKKYVTIYSSNYNDYDKINAHIRHRKFTDFIPDSFKLINYITNPYPISTESSNDGTTSFADFYIFEKIKLC